MLKGSSSTSVPLLFPISKKNRQFVVRSETCQGIVLVKQQQMTMKAETLAAMLKFNEEHAGILQQH